MHAIERPHLPRIGVVALGVILLAIVVLLLAHPFAETRRSNEGSSMGDDA